MQVKALSVIKGIATKKTYAQQGDILQVVSKHYTGKVYILENPRTKERFSVSAEQVQEIV